MTQPDQLIRGYVGEMLAAEKYLYELVKTQAETDASVKGAASVLGGKIAGLFEKVRSETASRMLRDAYCTLAGR